MRNLCIGSRFLSQEYVLVFLVMFTTGMASMLYEVVLISFFAATIGATELSSAIVIAGFLLGLAIGSLIGGKLSKKNISYTSTLIVVELLIAIYGFSFFSLVFLIDLFTLSNTWLYIFLGTMLLIPTTLMGVEIPIAVRILNKKPGESGEDAGFVYMSDTIGGVFGALLTGILFIPLLGFHGSMYFGGFLNIITALLVFILSVQLYRISPKILYGGVVLIFGIGLWFITTTDMWDTSNIKLFSSLHRNATIVESVSSPYQHILVTKNPSYGNSLFLNGRLQITEQDSLLYHEFLVRPALAAHSNPQKVLVIGGGDGGVLRQLLEADLSDITHVDLDEKVIEVSRKHLPLVSKGSLDDPKVSRVIADGRLFLEKTDEMFDIIVIDLPSPYFIKLELLYSQEFYQLVQQKLNRGGIVVTQASTPYLFLEAHTAILNTISSVFRHTYSYTVAGASLSSIGYVIGSDTVDSRTVHNRNIESGKWYNPTHHSELFINPTFLEDVYLNNNIPISIDNKPVIYRFLEPSYTGSGILDTD